MLAPSGVSRILLSLAFLLAVSGHPSPGTHPIKELSSHFSLDNGQLDSLLMLLLKIKQTAHRKAFGDRHFGYDAVEDAKKPVSISESQPEVTREFTPFLYEGDILLSPYQAESILASLETQSDPASRRDITTGRTGGRGLRRKRNFHADKLAKWTTFPIKYRFHESLAFYEITQIIKAIEFWESQTCVSFERIDELPDNEDCIEFFKGQGCYSMIGRNGGRQGVSIGQNCVKLGVIEHEIGHALGMWHEQARPDAPAYIKVLTDFILPSYISDFEQQGSEIVTLDIPYDLGSVMHYGPAAFSVDRMSRTLQTKDPFFQSTIGQRDSLSFYDVKAVNTAYCSDKCVGSLKCQHGGYPHPADCGRCLCPGGLGGRLCDQPAPAKNADCGGALIATADWQTFTSPGHPDPGYGPHQQCAWLIQSSDPSMRIELSFVDDFGFLCTSTCADFVEMKISRDLANTGFRICCESRPRDSFVSETSLALVIFQSQISSEDVGFKLQFRMTNLPARTTLPPPSTTSPPTPAPGSSSIVWAAWGEWSACSRTCGGCGIKSRVRVCPVQNCEGRRQEFSTCNLVACPIDKHCARLSMNKLCNGKVCTSPALLASCNEPQCCPPFFNVNGMCQSDDPILNDFIDL